MEKSYIIIYNTSMDRLEEDLKNNNITRYIILNNRIASIYVDESFDENVLNSIESIAWWEPSNAMSSLIELTNNLQNGENVRTAAGTEYIYKNPYITPTGTGIIIVIIDSGINYLHPDFIKSDNTTKIISIWDQESTLKSPPEGYLFGSEFTRDEINEYINRNDPSLSVDNVGTGTIAAGIATGLGHGNSNYEGVAIDAELVIIKLRSYKDTFAKGKVNYEESDFLAAIKYALEVADREHKRMVINLSVGSQSRASIEMAMIDSFNELSMTGRILVGGAGNEGNTDIHYSGNIQMSDKSQDIIIQVGEQLNLNITLSPVGPDKIGAAIISPGGEMSYIINYTPDPFVYRGKFNLEDTSYEMRYVYPWIKSGNQELIISLKNIKPGIWTLRMFPEFIINGNYNVYLPNKNLISPQTRFTDSSSEATITSLGIIKKLITVGAYNDRTDSIWIGSSKGPVVKRPIKPDIVAPGVDIIGPYQNDAYNTATGTGVSSSIVTGVVAIMMSYIISQEEESRNLLFSEPLKTFLMLGATRKDIYTYPNISQGYGILNLRNTLIAISNNL